MLLFVQFKIFDVTWSAAVSDRTLLQTAEKTSLVLENSRFTFGGLVMVCCGVQPWWRLIEQVK